MQLLLSPFALLVALSGPGSAHLACPSPPQEAARRAVPSHGEWLSPAVHEALLEVLRFEDEFIRLVSPFDQRGETISADQQAWRLTDPESPLKQYLDRHRARFDTHGLEMDVPGLRDCILYDAAYQVAADLVAAEPAFVPQDLLRAFELEFVDGAPIWASELAEDLYRRAQDDHTLSALGNGRALARLTWGVLQQEEWWSSEERDRGELILALLGRGLESRLVAEVVDLALANPLRPSPDPSIGGRGVCAPHLPVAQDVGYDQRHERALEGDLELVTYLSTIQDPTGAVVSLYQGQ